MFVRPVYLQGILSYSYVKDIESWSRSQEQNRQKSIFPQCETSIGKLSFYKTQNHMKFARSMRFLAMVDRMV